MKLGFVGAGRVGSTAAFATMNLVKCEEMALVDVVADLATGEAMDLETTAEALGKDIKISGGGDYSLLNGSDVIVITAGIARKPGMTRLDLTKTNVGIMRDVIKNVMSNTKDAIVVLVSNPVDILVHQATKMVGKREQVLGMGSLHDTVRLTKIMKNMGATKSEAVILGEHGDTMFPLKSRAKVKGVTLDWESLIKAVRERGMEIIKRKGATTYTPATCAAVMVRAIANNEKIEMPVSVVLNGEYGQKDVAMGVPAVIGRKGLIKIVEYELAEDDKKSMENSANVIRDMIKQIEGAA